MMLYLLDANILITAHNTYYPLDKVPEYWSWLQHQGAAGLVKIPIEILEEVREGRHDDILLNWITNDLNRGSLLLGEEVSLALVRRVVTEGYAPDLTDVQIEELGRDPFLVAYSMAGAQRCVVTTEVSKPTKTRQNRQLPDVCQTLGVAWCGPFQLNRDLALTRPDLEHESSSLSRRCNSIAGNLLGECVEYFWRCRRLTVV